MRPLIVDGNNTMMRCIMATAMDDLKAKGKITGGVYATILSVGGLLRRERYWPRIVCWDTNPPPWRFELCPEYKQHRRSDWDEATYEKVMAQRTHVMDVFTHLGFVALQYKDKEADDVIAACVRMLPRTPRPLVASSDKDLMQVIKMGADFYQTHKSRVITERMVYDEYGVPLEAWLTYRCLIGDKSDGIGGVPGIGEVNAKKALTAVMAQQRRFLEYPPEQQVVLIAKHFSEVTKNEKKPLKWQAALAGAATLLIRNVKMMDLSDSFGGTRGLLMKLKSEERRAAVNLEGLRDLCKELKFQSILTNWASYYDLRK